MLPVSAAESPLTVEPERASCVSAPAGVGPSATVDWPPPTFNPPQLRLLTVAPPTPPLRTAPQVPTGAPVTKRRTDPPPAMVVEVVPPVCVVVLVEPPVCELVLVVLDVIVMVVWVPGQWEKSMVHWG